MSKIIVSNIEWDWDEDNLWDQLMDMTAEEKSDIFGIDASTMSDDDIFDAAYDKLRHGKVSEESVFNLPETIEVDEEWDDEAIAEYISSEYGFCIYGFARSDDKKSEDEDVDDNTVFRLTFPDEDEREAAEKALDEKYEWYDYDNSDRMMVYLNGLNILSDAGIDYDEV